MEEKKVSIAEMLQMTVDLIEGIQVPVRYADEISRPLCQAIGNLRGVMDAIIRAAEEQEEEKDGESQGV